MRFHIFFIESSILFFIRQKLPSCVVVGSHRVNEIQVNGLLFGQHFMTGD